MPKTADTAALRGAIALAASAPDAVLLAALLDWPVARVHDALARAGAALQADADADALASVARWQQLDPPAATAAVARAIAWHLQQGRPEAAARIALGCGSPMQAVDVLVDAGWLLTFRRERALAGALLARVALLPQAVDPTLRMLRYVWRIEVERLPHVAERALRSETALDAPRLALLRARMAQMYDQPACALADAEQAAAAFEDDDLQPESLLARYALGAASLEAGRPRDALAPLQRLVRACDRDGLPLLALDALHVLARAHDELGDRAAVLRTLALARPLADGAPADLPALHGLERLRRGLEQRRAGGADDTGGAIVEREPDAAYGAFPYLVLDAAEALGADRLDAAAATLAELDRRVAAAFHCRKWRLEQAHAALWLAARRGDRATLETAAAAQVPTGADANLFDLHEAVLAAAAAALAGRPADAAALAALDARLAAVGLGRLRRRLALVRALAPDADPAGLLGWLEAALADGEIDDALWLAPKLAMRLDALLAAPRAARHDAERALARRLLDRMLAPLAPAPADADAAPPPADLTAREWQILQLIGARLTNEQIAARLHVSVATVKTHINRVYAKLGIASRSEAVQRARDIG